MRFLVLCCSILLVTPAGLSQTQTQTYTPTPAELKQYEGTYAGPDGEVRVGLSPRDHELHALVLESDYLLHPVSQDIFSTVGTQRVQFVRENGKVIGYREMQE